MTTGFDTKRIFLLFYVVIPFIFYSLPFISVYEIGYFPAAFYGGIKVHANDIFDVLLGHLILGGCIYYIFNSSCSKLEIRYNSKFFSFISVVCVSVMIFSHGISSTILYAIFFICIGNIKPNKFFVLFLIAVSIFNLLYFGERFLIIYILIWLALPFISKRTILELLLLVLFGLFIMIYILQPLKIGNIPFNNYVSINQAFSYAIQHLSPIYYAAYLSNTMNFTHGALLAEFIPFAKSLLSVHGVVYELSNAVLPQSIFSSGTRLGSNSAMYFSWFGSSLLILMLLILKFILVVFRSRILHNSIVIYFIVQGPFFIRRTFASYMIDIFMILALVFIVSLAIIACKNLIQFRNNNI